MAIHYCGTKCTSQSHHQCGDPQVAYEGCVLGLREINGWSDSDFNAYVWDEASQSVQTIMYATTRFPSYHCNAHIDATPEVIAKATNYFYLRAVASIRLDDVKRAKTPARGKRVRVVAGRKVPIGTVAWVGPTYRSAYDASEVCDIDSINGARFHYVAIKNLEVIEFEQYLMSSEEIVSRAKLCAAQLATYPGTILGM